jgi:hypothetical protein
MKNITIIMVVFFATILLAIACSKPPATPTITAKTTYDKVTKLQPESEQVTDRNDPDFGKDMGFSMRDYVFKDGGTFSIIRYSLDRSKNEEDGNLVFVSETHPLENFRGLNQFYRYRDQDGGRWDILSRQGQWTFATKPNGITEMDMFQYDDANLRITARDINRHPNWKPISEGELTQLDTNIQAALSYGQGQTGSLVDVPQSYTKVVPRLLPQGTVVPTSTFEQGTVQTVVVQYASNEEDAMRYLKEAYNKGHFVGVWGFPELAKKLVSGDYK